MPSISLSTYLIRVRKRFDRSSASERLGDIGGKDLHGVVHGFLHSLQKEHSHNPKTKQLQNVTNLASDEDSIWGFIKSGDYGFEADGVNAQTLEVSYTRTQEDAEMIPFFFLLVLPDNAERGVLVLQRLGSRGVHTPFTAGLLEYFGLACKDYMMEISPLAPPEVMQLLTRGVLKRVAVTTYNVPADFVDQVGLRGFPQQEAKYTLTVEAKKDRQLIMPSWFSDELSKKTTLHELRGMGEEGKEISITVQFMGKQRTVSFERPDRVAPYVDVTDEVDTVKGHPVLESILEVARKMVDSVSTDIGLLR